jgi:hypothetical protein
VSERRAPKRQLLNRRAFLYGAGGVAIGLPFLEGMPDRSAWAAGSEPVFAFFMTAACGVEPTRFFPTTPGPLGTVLASNDKAVCQLRQHAEHLLVLRGIDYPQTRPMGCGHAEGLSQALTGNVPMGSGSAASGSGPSADVVISQALNPAGTDPMTLYAGNLNNGYIEERLSFDTNGKVRAANDNPYKLYQELVGLATPAGNGTPAPNPMADELLARRRSANDLVRAELGALLQSAKTSAADKQRLQQHFDAIRDVENTMMAMATAACSLDGIDTTAMDALKSWKYSRTNLPSGGIENIVLLHMQLVALAFACNHNRVASLQWGDGTDATIYDTPSNRELGNWGLHYISHRVQSNSEVGTNMTAELAHAEIDVLRMQTLAAGLNHFRDRGLSDKAFVMWNNHVAEGNHQMRNVPHVIWGNAGGVLKQGEYIDASGQNNATLLNVLIGAATGTPTTSFGASGGKELNDIKA